MKAAVADLRGVAGEGLATFWSDRGVDPAGGKVPWIHESPFPDFRRLDPLSRFCCLAVEALGREFEPGSALVLATTLGCLHADRRFQATLETMPSPAVFPYTLPSTCLGDIAIRHKIVGPVLCLTTAPGRLHEGVDEARRLLDFGEAPAAIVCLGDVVPPEAEIVAALVRPGDDGPVPSAADIWGRA